MTNDKDVSQKIISKTINILAPASIVWNVLTNPEMIRQWMSDEALHITSEWKVGSAIHFQGTLHGMDFENKGTILKLERESVFSYTFWSTLSEHDDIPENYSTITFTLTAAINSTTLTLTQCDFETEVIYSHFNFYWHATLGILKKVSEDSLHKTR